MSRRPEGSGWEPRSELVPALALVVVTVFYGGTFRIVQGAIEDVTPWGFLLLRFAIGSLALLPFAFRRGWQRPGVPATKRGFIGASVVFGILSFVGLALQTVGLQYTSTSNSAFITGLFVVFTPILAVATTRVLPPARVALAVGLAVIGLFFLEGGSLALGWGDSLTLLAAIAFAAWILMAGTASLRYDPIVLTVVQLVTVFVLAVPFALVAGVGRVSAAAIWGAVITGLFATAAAFSLQFWAQRYVEPTRAAVILLLEPVVAGVLGYLGGERIGISGYAGAVLILVGILVAESRSWRTLRLAREAARRGESGAL
ncbi:MAG: DMT family transporter [Actinomycetota bacterium]